MKKRILNSKAVSEILGFILIFSMIMMAVSLIYVQVYPEINKQQEYATLNSMENSFIIMQNIEYPVAYNILPTKTVNLRVEKGVIYAIPNFGNMSIIINGKNIRYSYGVLVYEVGNSKILLENGAVIECFGDEGCICLSNPKIFRVSDEVFISLVNINGSMGLAGLGQITFKNDGSRLLLTNTKVYNISITFNTPTYKWWVNYFRSMGFHVINNTTVSANNINVTIVIHNISVS